MADAYMFISSLASLSARLMVRVSDDAMAIFYLVFSPRFIPMMRTCEQQSIYDECWL